MQFYLSDPNHPIDRNHPIWKKPLPLSRHGRPQPDDRRPETVLTYGEYFSAVKSFFNDLPDGAAAAAFPASVYPIGGSAFHEHLCVYLEKHGAFYHPSRIAVSAGNRPLECVLNVAVSAVGQKCLENEYNTLKMLAAKYGYPFLPRVFASREIRLDGSRAVSMFLGEWFEACHEFHMSGANDGDSRRIRVWDPRDERRFLSEDQAQSVYEQAAMILTASYDIETFEQVFAWHHAAGDFVVNLDEPLAPRVKLVTIRQYAPLFKAGEEGPGAVLNGLLLFLLNMSIRMRLDRLDGVGDICWLDDCVVQATLSGFLKGLALQQQNRRVPPGFIEYFESMLVEMSAREVLDLFTAIVGRLDPGSPDRAIIKTHIEGHAAAFKRVIGTVF